MITCIMQPTFMPWIGYFNLIAKSNIFVFLDDVEYSKGSWHNRNYIFLGNQPHRISIPIIKQTNSTFLYKTKINYDELNLKKLSRLLIQNYSKSEFFYLFENFLDDLVTKKFVTLSDLNIHWIQKLSNKLGLKSNFVRSSDLKIYNCDKIIRISKILNLLKATAYLSPSGAREYLEDGNYKNIIKQPVKFNDFLCDYSSYKTKEDSNINLSILSLFMDNDIKMSSKINFVLNRGVNE